jgi:hypothetical protein
MFGKVPLQEAWDSDEVSPTAKSRVDACEEIIGMGGQDPRAFYQRGIPSVRHHGDKKHCIWQKYDRDIDEPESCLGSSVRLGERVDESHG